MHGHVSKSRDLSVFPPQDAGELSCRVLRLPLASFSLLPVLDRSRETEAGSTKVVRDLGHTCCGEGMRKLGLFRLLKRAKELSPSCLQLLGG